MALRKCGGLALMALVMVVATTGCDPSGSLGHFHGSV